MSCTGGHPVGSMLMLNPPEHTRIRRAVSAAFTPGRVAALRPAISRITEELCDGLDCTCDFVERLAFPLPVTVIGELLGIPAADRSMFQDLSRDWSSVLEMLSPLAVERADRAAAEVRGCLADLAEARRVPLADDLISAMVTAADPLPDEDMLTTAALLLAAGFETTTGLPPGHSARWRTRDAAGGWQRTGTPVCQSLLGKASGRAVR